MQKVETIIYYLIDDTHAVWYEKLQHGFVQAHIIPAVSIPQGAKIIDAYGVKHDTNKSSKTSSSSEI